MSKFDDLVPEFVRSLPGYVPGKPARQAEAESGVKAIKMASNENPFGPSPRAMAAMAQAVTHVNLYPDNETSQLRLRLAELHGLGSEQVMVTNGSTAFLNIIARTLLRPGLNAITSERSFIVYPLVTGAAGARLVTVPMRDDTFDLDGILAAIDQNTRLVFLANPNNPTGTLVDAAAVDRFVERVPEHVTVILDEAYSEFAYDFAARRGLEYTHSLDYVRQGRNVVVLRTFSKAQGLAGIRVGYGFASATMVGYFARLKIPFAVSAVAEAAALAALGDTDHIRKTVENNRLGAEFLLQKFREMGIRAVPTFSNFIYFEVGEDAPAVAKRMQSEGVVIRPLTGQWGAPRALRVTIGTPEQNQRFVEALTKSLAGAAATK